MLSPLGNSVNRGNPHPSSSQKPSRPIYTAWCISMQTALQTAASSSDESVDLLG